jgi:hypothetical protein
LPLVQPSAEAVRRSASRRRSTCGLTPG